MTRAAGTSHEQRVLDAIDDDGLIRFLCGLVAIRSDGGRETAAQQHMASTLRAIGLEVDEWEIDLEALTRHPAYCAEIERREGLGVVGRLQGGGGPTLALNGHVDVVPPGDESNWRVPPWEGTVAGGRVYGRGALDMKGGLACAVFAAKAIRDADVTLRGALLLHSVIGEEDGGLGTLATILRGHRADAAIVMEPTGMVVAPAHAGALNFRLTVSGRSAHGAMREEGVSALEKFLPLHEALLAFEHERNSGVRDPLFRAYRLPYPITMGVVRAGNWPSNVPESLVCEGRFGVAIDESVDEARAAFARVVERTAGKDRWLAANPPRLEWWGGQFAPAHTPPDARIVAVLREAAGEVLGRPAEMEGMTYGADMRLLVHEGHTPTVLFGPGDIRWAHRPDESVPIADLRATTRVLALTALRFCGYED